MHTVRNVKKKDLEELIKIENDNFVVDGLNRRSFLWMIQEAHRVFRVIVSVDDSIISTKKKIKTDLITDSHSLKNKEKVLGYYILLVKKNTSMSRLYSLAISINHQGKGLSKILMNDMEEQLYQHGLAYLRLEVREDNKVAQNLYNQLGFRFLEKRLNYYSDGANALVLEKRLSFTQSQKDQKFKKPYYAQTTDFTCGAACLMMAIKYFYPKTSLTRVLELAIWREATTIFMMSGHGGCGPLGLSLSAFRRGLKPKVYTSHKKSVFVDSVRDPQKKEIISLVHEEFNDLVNKYKIPIFHKKFTIEDIEDNILKGLFVIVLISQYRMGQKKTPHWVVITHTDNKFIFIHDPDEDENDPSPLYVPIPKKKFLEMCSWGQHKARFLIAIASIKK